MVTVDELIAQGDQSRPAAPDAVPRREIRLLLSRVLGWPEARVMSNGESDVSPMDAEQFHSLLARRRSGEPVAYLLGEREFFGRSFLVDSRVLIPRPETEHLIEAALEHLPEGTPRILDIGTGSGCLAVTLACEIPSASTVATDRSLAAAAVARHNVLRHGVEDRVAVLASDLATSVDLRDFNLVVSNPPYVDPADTRVSPEVIGFEPSTAVFAADRGDRVIHRLLSGLSDLARGTVFCFEIGDGQAERIVKHTDTSKFEVIEVRNDLAGIPRVVLTRRRAG